MRARTFFLAGLALFAVLSVTDFIQTFALISGGDGQVYEANPVAALWLERYGWHGLAVFKAGTVFLFVAAAVLLVRRHPRAGAGVVALGCAALLLVTNYSGQLLAEPPEAEEPDFTSAQWVVVIPASRPDEPAQAPTGRHPLPGHDYSPNSGRRPLPR